MANELCSIPPSLGVFFVSFRDDGQRCVFISTLYDKIDLYRIKILIDFIMISWLPNVSVVASAKDQEYRVARLNRRCKLLFHRPNILHEMRNTLRQSYPPFVPKYRIPERLLL